MFIFTKRIPWLNKSFRINLKVVLGMCLTIIIVIYIFLYPISNLNNDNENQKNVYLEKSVAEIRKDFIRASFKDTWAKFIEKSNGADEIDPITGTSKTTWGGWGVTLIDSLDTLYLMNLTEEFEDAAKKISKVDFTKGDITTAFFEVVIRNLGGLLSAYDLSGKKIFLKKAKDLGDLLMKDFSPPSGFPYRDFDFKAQKPVTKSTISLASIGTCQLEFSRLSQLTGDPKYRNIALTIYDNLDKVKRSPGVFNIQLSTNTGKFINNEISFGAEGDSFYEYLLKVPILLGSKDTKHSKFLRMFHEAMEVLQDKLIKPCFGGKICLGRINQFEEFQTGTQHLELFIPGLLLLGGNYTSNKKLTEKGIRLLDSFIEIPKISATGLVPEYINFYDNKPMTFNDKSNRLRPELVESLFYAHRYTKHEKYRETTWKIFKAFETYSHVNYGFAEYTDVTNSDAKNQVEGNMPSYFFAETFKYIYLTFCEDDILPLEHWVFNTEAHPFKISS